MLKINFNSNWPHRMTYAALLVAAVGIFMSISFAGLAHILFLIPGLYFVRVYLRNKSFSLPLRFWGLFLVWATCVLSVLFNLDILKQPSYNLLKSKYFLIGMLSFFAIHYGAKKYLNKKKIRLVLNLSLIFTSVASLSGIIGLFSGYNPLRMQEACSLMQNCGMFGMLMTYAYGLSLYMVALGGILIHKKELKDYFNPKLAWMAFAINLWGLYLTYARGAWIGFLIAIPFFFFKKKKKKFIASMLGMTLLFGGIILSSPNAKRRFFHSQGSDIKRLAFFKTAYHAFKERPFWGYGYRNFEPNVAKLKKKYNIPVAPDMTGHAHNNFLEHLASTGIVGALAFILFCLLWMIDSYKRREITGRIIFPVTISFMVSGMVQYTFGDGENLFLLMLLWAI